MTKELKNVCENLRKDITAELREFRGTDERDLRKELNEINASLISTNKLYKEMKSEIRTAKTEQKSLRAENTRLQSLCGEQTT